MLWQIKTYIFVIITAVQSSNFKWKLWDYIAALYRALESWLLKSFCYLLACPFWQGITQINLEMKYLPFEKDKVEKYLHQKFHAML